MPIRPEEYTRALRRWTSGVTIVTSRTGERLHGMTVSAFASVSLEPPLVLVCADKTSDTHAVIAEAGFFAANILSSDQERLSRRFAREGNEERRFEGVAWTPAASGAPMLPGSLVSLDCRVVDAHDAGDHVIYVGRVEAARLGDREPLVYFDGGYRALAAPKTPERA